MSQIGREDVMLEVAPERQMQLAECVVGATTKVVLTVSSFPGAGKFKESTPYRYFESAGVSFDSIAAGLHQDGVEVSGRRLA